MLKAKLYGPIHLAGAMWLFSRLFIAAAMLLITPYSAPPEGLAHSWLGSLYMWDSLLYDQIATSGYEYANDGKGHNVASSPFLVIRAVMTLGLLFNVAGNTGQSGMVRCSFCTVGSRSVMIAAAWWATAVLACVLSVWNGDLL